MRKLMLVMTALAITIVGIDESQAFDVKNKFMISALGGVGIPLGNFADSDSSNVHAGGANTGFNLGLTVEYGITEQFLVGGRFAYNRFDAHPEINHTNFPLDASDEAFWTIFEVVGAYGKLLLLPGQNTRPFIRGGMFLGIPEAYIRTEDFYISKEFDPSIGFDFGVGATQRLTERFRLSLEGRFALLTVNQRNLYPGFNGLLAPSSVNAPTGIRDPGGNLTWLAVNAVVSYGL